MFFPNEIWEIILSNVYDPVNLSNFRQTCKLFNYILTNRTKIIKDERKNDHFPKLSRNKSLNLNFLYSFSNLKILDFPVQINNFKNLYKISELNLSKITINIDKKNTISVLLFLVSYKKEKSLKNVVFKIIQGKSIRWLTNKKYALYNSEFEIADNYLMGLCNCKTLITNSNYRLESSLKNLIYLSPIERLKFIDYMPPLHVKSYSWRPIATEDRRKINKLTKLSASINALQEVRPNIKKYEMPILPKHSEKMKDVFFNSKNFAVLHEGNCYENYENKLVYYYSSKIYYKNGIDLDNLPEGEDYIDSLFDFQL
jgi:hypothetical protein